MPNFDFAMTLSVSLYLCVWSQMSYAKNNLAARSSLFGDRGDRDIERAIPSGGTGSNGMFDGGQQERENDHAIEHLSDRVAGLKKVGEV